MIIILAKRKSILLLLPLCLAQTNTPVKLLQKWPPCDKIREEKIIIIKNLVLASFCDLLASLRDPSIHLVFQRNFDTLNCQGIKITHIKVLGTINHTLIILSGIRFGQPNRKT